MANKKIPINLFLLKLSKVINNRAKYIINEYTNSVDTSLFIDMADKLFKNNIKTNVANKALL